MYCLEKNLCEMFNSTETKFGAEKLVNSASDKGDETNWAFEPESLMISNNSHWKGIFPRDSNLRNTLVLYFGGFWKRFEKNGSDISGITHPYEVNVFARNKATETNLRGLR